MEVLFWGIVWLPVDENYKARLLVLLDKLEHEAPQQVEDAFVYNAWQA